MDLSVRQIGTLDRPLTLIRQAASAANARAASRHFLLCRPIGQEGTRTSAMYRVMAEQLCKAGIHVWRFDYHATGDSSGDESLETINSWAHDLVLVHQHICEEASGGDIQWFAMRLGVEIANQACRQLSTRLPSRLVCWDPITNGQQYIESLIAGHQRDLVREYGYPWEQLLSQKRVVDVSLPGYVLGFHYGQALTDVIQKMRSPVFTDCIYQGIQMTVGCKIADQAELQRNNPIGVRWLTVEEDTDWLASEAQGSSIVPRSVLQALMTP